MHPTLICTIYTVLHLSDLHVPSGPVRRSPETVSRLPPLHSSMKWDWNMPKHATKSAHSTGQETRSEVFFVPHFTSNNHHRQTETREHLGACRHNPVAKLAPTNSIETSKARVTPYLLTKMSRHSCHSSPQNSFLECGFCTSKYYVVTLTRTRVSDCLVKCRGNKGRPVPRARLQLAQDMSM